MANRKKQNVGFKQPTKFTQQIYSGGNIRNNDIIIIILKINFSNFFFRHNEGKTESMKQKNRKFAKSKN